jgi:hypothetical protein
MSWAKTAVRHDALAPKTHHILPAIDIRKTLAT